MRIPTLVCAAPVLAGACGGGGDRTRPQGDPAQTASTYTGNADRNARRHARAQTEQGSELQASQQLSSQGKFFGLRQPITEELGGGTGAARPMTEEQRRRLASDTRELIQTYQAAMRTKQQQE